MATHQLILTVLSRLLRLNMLVPVYDIVLFILGPITSLNLFAGIRLVLGLGAFNQI